MPETPLRVVALAGSLRQASFNRSLLRAAQELAPSSLAIEIHDLADIPVFNEDVERQGNPPAVTALQEAVRAADGVLIASPEYNNGIPGGLKNVIDWLSRSKNPLKGKPTAICGASPGPVGTALAQAQLRQVLANTDTPVMPQPRVVIGTAHERFDAEGRLVHEQTRQFLTLFLESFARWIERLR